MFDIRPFETEHLLSLIHEPANKEYETWFKSGLAFELEKTDAVSFFVKDRLQLCGGIRPYWPGRGQIWIVFSEHIKHSFVPSFRAINKWLTYQLKNNYKRIELSVDHSFPLGRRRAELLGFKLDVEIADQFLPSGEACSLYSMVRQ